MDNHPRSHAAEDRCNSEFGSTRWSIVLAAGQASTADAREALAILCRHYWYPLYAYVRRRRHNADEAQDLIQEFFARLLEKNLIGKADPQRGRFRSFLLTSLRNFLANEWAKARSAKRHPEHPPLSLDLQSGEARYVGEPVDTLTPERLFERRWAETLLDRVTEQLRQEFIRAGKQAHFEQLAPFLAGRNQDVCYANAAAQLGISEGAAMVAALRMRRRFRHLLRSEIAHTVADPRTVDEEIQQLFAALSS
jgi:RNA polymerase sigma-70 factor (ECF subfamily)